MKKNNLYYGSTIMMAAIAALQFSSCNDDIVEVETTDAPQQQSTYDDNLLVGDNETKIVTTLMFDQKGFEPICTNADTTQIQISYSVQHEKFIPGQYLAIWNSPNEPSFLVKVISAQSQDKGGRQGLIPYEIYNVEPACFSEVVDEGTYNFDLNPYVDENKELRLQDGRINSECYYDAENQVYHPVAYVVQSNEMLCNDGSQYYELPVARWTSPLVEDHLNENGSADFMLFDLTNTITNFRVALGDSCGSFGMDKLVIELKAGAHFRLDVGTKYLVVPYVKTFEAAVNGKLKTSIDVSLSFGKDIKLWDKSVPMIRLGHIVSTFMVGPIPVSVDCDPTIDLQTKADAQGKFKIASHFGFDTDLQAGVGYYDNGGWKNLSHAHATDSLSFAVPVLYGQAKATVGVMFTCPIKLFDVAGPKASAGPQIVGKFEGQVNLNNGHIDCDGEVDFKIGGIVGAELSFMGIKLADWTTSLDLYTKELWKAPWSTKSDDSKEAAKMIDEAIRSTVDGILPAGIPYTFICNDDLTYSKVTYNPGSNEVNLHMTYCQERGFTPTEGQYFVIWPEGQEKPDVIQLRNVSTVSCTPCYHCSFTSINNH